MDEPMGRGETSVRDFVTVILRRKWVILALVLSTSCYMAWRAAKTQVMYRSTGQILIRPGERASTMVAHLNFRPWEEVVNSEIAILESQPIVDRATEILRLEYEAEGISRKPRPVVRKRIKTEPKRNSNIVDVRYSHRDASIVQRSLDAILQAYVSVHKELFRLPDAHEMFNREVMRAQRELELLERSRKEYAERMGISSVEREKADVLGELRLLSARRNELLQSIGVKKEEIRQTELLTGELDLGASPYVSKYGVVEATAIADSRRDLVNLEGQRRSLLVKYTENHAQVQALDEQIEEVRDRMRNMVRSEIRVRQSDLGAVEQQLEIVEQQIALLEGELTQFPEREMSMNQYDRSLWLASEAFKELLVNETRMKISEVSARDYEVVILSSASSPEPTNPRDPVRLSLAPALSLFLGIGLAFFLDRLDHSLKNREDVENYLRLPVLASVPEVRLRRRP